MATRRRFTREFKLDILRQAEHQPLAEVCREHNLQPTLVNRWKREQQQYPKEAFRGKGNLYKLEAQVAKYERLVGQLYAENALLKKAIASLQERQAEERMLRSTK
jgi:transposase-like protein